MLCYVLLCYCNHPSQLIKQARAQALSASSADLVEEDQEVCSSQRVILIFSMITLTTEGDRGGESSSVPVGNSVAQFGRFSGEFWLVYVANQVYSSLCADLVNQVIFNGVCILVTVFSFFQPG